MNSYHGHDGRGWLLSVPFGRPASSATRNTATNNAEVVLLIIPNDLDRTRVLDGMQLGSFSSTITSLEKRIIETLYSETRCMNAVDYIKMALENGKGWTLGLINDMKDAPLTQPTSNGGNHPLWVLGHIVRAESDLLDGFILGKPNRFPELESAFSMGSTPTADASQYPSMDELMGKFEQIRSASLAHLNSLSDADLDKRSHAPDEFGPPFATVGACFAAMVGHMSFHGGQVADARRAAGRAPLMA